VAVAAGVPPVTAEWAWAVLVQVRAVHPDRRRAAEEMDRRRAQRVARWKEQRAARRAGIPGYARKPSEISNGKTITESLDDIATAGGDSMAAWWRGRKRELQLG